jgi:chromosome segregation ATPase
VKETKAAREALIEARMETEAIEKEKNQLMANWASCLIGMKRRDEAHSQMNDAIRAQKQKYDSTLSEINSYKKSIIKEQEKNENLTIMINHRKGETKNFDKQLKGNRDKMDLLQQEYSAYNRALKETESTLGSINMEKTQKASLINQYQRDIEIISQEKIKLEDEIFQKLQTKLTADKAAKYSDKLRMEQREKLRELERALAKLDNEIAKAKLEAVQTQTLNEALERDIKMLNTELEDKNKIISKSESEIRQRILIIEHKQSAIDLLNKKIENLVEKAGGIELGPLELEEKSLAKQIEDYLQKIMELEQKWLREQNELVRLIKEHQKKDIDLKHQQKNFIVLTTKKMRIESKSEL